MTEDRIERHAERMMDHLDHRFLNSAMTQAEYDIECKKIDDWAKAQFTKMRSSGK